MSIGGLFFKFKAVAMVGKFLPILGILFGIMFTANTCVGNISKGGYNEALVDEREDRIDELEDKLKEREKAYNKLMELSQELREELEEETEEWREFKGLVMEDIEVIKSTGEGEPCPANCIMPTLEN